MANHLQNQKAEAKHQLALPLGESQRLCEEEYSDEEEVRKSRKRSAVEHQHQPRKYKFELLLKFTIPR